MNIDTLKESPLRAEHERASAKMIDFAGWRMPVQYAGILPEHLSVRQSSGIFDISHMGQVFVEGSKAAEWLDSLLTNRVKDLDLHQGQYTLMLNEKGGVIDDLILYRVGKMRFLLVVNASTADIDFQWLEAHRSDGITLENGSAAFGGLAVQGPKAVILAKQICGDGEALPDRNGIALWQSPSGVGYVCRTGYTGEDGFELFIPVEDVAEWWQRLVALGVIPCGLGARDTLRLEMGYPLNGSDLTQDHTPLEAGLGFAVALDKGDFLGRAILAEQKAAGVDRFLVAVEMEGKGPPLRAGYELFSSDKKIGTLTSGCLSPSLNHGIGMAYLPTSFRRPGETLEVEIRGRRFPVVTVKKPFYKSASRKKS